MIRLLRMSLSAVLMLVMLASSFAIVANPASAVQDTNIERAPATLPNEGPLSVDVGLTKLTSVSSEQKIDALLAQQMKNSIGPFKVYVLVTDRVAVNEYLAANGLPTIAGFELPGLPTTRVMDLYSNQISALAKNPGVYSIMTYEKPVYDQAPIDRALEDVPIDIAKPGTEDFDVDRLHGATAAWADGFTGDGVKVAVIDTGMDMAHPDLQGQQARYADPASPYFGWPIAYDDRAAALWSTDTIGGWVADTSAGRADLGGYINFDGVDYSIAGLQDVLGNPVTSQSGVYHVGYHTDQNLMMLWGEPIAVLVVDAITAGVYDTVYVDVTDDWDFASDKACTKGDEISYFDFYDSFTSGEDWTRWNGGDGYADLSGGMVYWISDGANMLPGVDWLYGGSFVPSSGEAVAFVGEFGYGESHGTMTSSAALGNGASYGGMLTGMAPEAKLIAIPLTNDVVASWLFAEFGADGVENTGDEANIVSNSYGYSNTAVEAGYTLFDQYTSLISLIGAQTLWFWSSGNGGPGYGTVHAPADFLSVKVGATTTMQYRYWLGYENNLAYTTWGDMAPFSNSGPSRTGKLNAEISASGMYSMEPAPLNEAAYGGLGDGYVHFQLGSGTSHAAPTVAGGAALGFQAFFELYGYMPSIDYAKAKLMAAADDMHYDPLKQGAGWLNASTYAKLMGEYAGVESILASEPVLTKAALYPGTYDGTSTGVSYDNFPNFLLPDEYDDTHIVTTTNYDPINDATVDISAEMLMSIGYDTLDWITTDSGDQWIDIRPMIPLGTDLVKITWFMPFDEFDPEMDYVSNYQYWLETHDWVDENMDGILNITDGEWELYRMAVDGSDSNYNQISVRDPLDRTHDGLYVRVRSILGGEDLDMNLQLDYYQLQTFDWIQFRLVGDPVYSTTLSATVPAMSSIDWQVEVYVPFDAYVGTYAAAIYIDDGSRVQDIPVVINVPASDYEFNFGGSNYFDTTYNNDFTGESNKGWRFEVGDWRIYWCLPTTAPPSPDTSLIVSVSWSDLPTDVNVHVLAATSANGWDTYDLPFGPNLMEKRIASSDERYMGAGIFGIGTSTGGPTEVISAPLGAAITATGPAPFAILTRAPVQDGYAVRDNLYGYTTWLTMNGYDPSDVDLGDPSLVSTSGSVPGWYDMTVGGSVEARGGGVGPLRSDTYPAQEIYQDMMSGNFQLDLANAAYTRTIQVIGSSVLIVSTAGVSGVPDIDLGLWYDANMNGIAELSEPYWYVGISGSTESLSLENPADGQYLIKVLGYAVTGNPGYFNLTVMMGVPGYIQAYLYENWVMSGYHTFEIDWSVPSETGVYFGLATFGFMGADDMFSIPVTIHVDMTAPTIENINPADGSVAGSSSLVVTFDVVDTGAFASGVDWYNIYLTLDGFWSTASGSIWMQISPPTVSVVVPLSLAQGMHELQIWAYDNWGNEAYSDTTFTVNSVIEKFTAEWADPISGDPIPDGSTVAMTNVILRGYTDTNATVEVMAPAGGSSTIADPTGYYEFDPFALVSGLNIVTVTTTNDGGVRASIIKMLSSDTYCTLWTLEVESPTENPVAQILGMTDPGAMLTFNSVPVPVMPDGTFGQNVALSEGLNTIVVSAVDPVGNTNEVTIEVVLDTTPPSLAISGPADGSSVSEPSAMVYGTTEAGATVWVNGVLASNGTTDWAATVVLSEGLNTIIVTADDEVGNSAMLVITVEYVPPVYVTPEELAAVQAELMGLINNLTASLTENVSTLQAEIDDLVAALAENVSDLQTQIDTAIADITALQASLAENVSVLQAQVNALVASLAENVSLLQGQIDTALADILAVQTALAENVTDLQGQIDTLQAQIDVAVADIADLQASLEENVTELQTQITDAVASITELQSSLAENVTALENADDALKADLLANVTALTAAITANVTALQSLIDALEGNVSQLQTNLSTQVATLQTEITAAQAATAAVQTALQGQIDTLEANLTAAKTNLQNQVNGLNNTVQHDITDLQDQIDGLNQTTQDDIGTVDQKAKDASAFASMLMYLTLILFAIAIILIGLVWYMMSSKIDGGTGGAGQNLEEVEEGPSEVEREFELLEKEIKNEER